MVRGQHGQALVELALVLPVLLTLTLATVQLAQVGVVRLALEHAAAEGARTGALTNDDALVRESVIAAGAPLDANEIAIDIDPPQHVPPRTADPRGSLLFVTARTALRPLVVFVLPTIELHATAARRIEWTP